MCASYWIYVSNCAHSTRYVCDSFLSISLEVSLASAWIGNDRADPWKANTQNIGYISLRCAFMLFEHEVANIEQFFKTRASAHTGGELLSTLSSVVCVPSSSWSNFFPGWLLVCLASFRWGALRMGEEHWRLLLKLGDSVHDTVILSLQVWRCCAVRHRPGPRTFMAHVFVFDLGNYSG